jgi:hypothetical protein
VEYLEIDLNRLGEWAFENEMKIIPAKSKAVYFRKTRDGFAKLFIKETY